MIKRTQKKIKGAKMAKNSPICGKSVHYTEEDIIKLEVFCQTKIKAFTNFYRFWLKNSSKHTPPPPSILSIKH